MGSAKDLRRWGLRLAALAVVVAIAGWGLSGRARLVEGACQDVFGAPVCVWAKTADGTVATFGATVPIRTIEDAPAEGEMLWPPPTAAILPLPAEVKQATGFDNFQMSWEHHGHPPEPYLTPHFDFHFYTIPIAQVKAIDCSDRRKPAVVPAGYGMPDIDIPGLGMLWGLCVPTMGMHALPEAELSGVVPFTRAMVMGFYGGESIFIEPMITRAALLERKGFDLAIPDVADKPASVRYPAAFRVDYDAQAGAYRFIFTTAGRS